MFVKKFLIPGVLGLALTGGAHAAATFAQALVPGLNTISDDNAELILKWDATTSAYRKFNAATDKVDKKDILVGVVGITSFPTGALGTSDSLYNQITGIYAVEALTATPYGGANPGAACGSSLLTTCTYYDFGAATSASATDPLNNALSLVNSLYGTSIPTYLNTTANSFGLILEDDDGTPTPFVRTAASWDAVFNSHEDGTLRMVLDLAGPDGDPATTDDYFFTNAPADVTQLGLVPAGANAGSFGGQGTIQYQNIPGWNVGPKMTITGNIRAGNGGPAEIWTDSTYSFPAQRQVPEPTTLALIGLALLGIGAGRRIRKA